MKCFSPKVRGLVATACGRCAACLQKKRNAKRVQLTHELLSHRHSVLLTLTYDNGNIVETIKEAKDDALRFIHSLRVYSLRHGFRSFRYFQCVEFGSRTGRIHIHLLLFGVHPFVAGAFNEALVKRIWHRGFVSIRNAFISSAPYIAKYCVKDTGERTATSSIRLGVAYAYKIKDSFRRTGRININGYKYCVPQIYKRYCYSEADKRFWKVVRYLYNLEFPKPNLSELLADCLQRRLDYEAIQGFCSYRVF